MSVSGKDIRKMMIRTHYVTKRHNICQDLAEIRERV